MKKNVLIYNFGQHYREPIFKKIDKELNFDFYFGENKSNIKTFNYSNLRGFKKTFKHINIYKGIYWHKNLLGLAFKKYDNYILLGEYFCLTHWLLFPLLRIQGKNVVLWTHGWYGNESILKKLIKKIYFAFANQILLYGNYAKKLMVEEGINEKKLSVIYNSLNFEVQNTLFLNKKENDVFKNYFKNDFKVIIYIGRLEKSKKINLLIDALKHLKEQKSCFNLVVVGNGEDELNIIENVKDKKLEENVWFYGATYDESEIATLITNSFVCVSPGNVGLTAIHSLTYGTPVITHSNFKNQGPEFEAIVKDKSGDFFKENSVEDLSNVIIDFYIKNKDKSKDEISKKCREIILKRYNPKYQMDILKQILNEK